MKSTYIRACGSSLLTPLYDPLLKWLMRERLLRGALLEQAALKAGHQILDVGCGTATFAVLAKRTIPKIAIWGLDPDPAILRIARRKSEKAGAAVFLLRGDAAYLPYPKDTFDRVFMSLMLHHLTTEQKIEALREACRVLRPGGELHVLDFGSPQSGYAAVVSQLLRFAERVEDNLDGLIPGMMRGVGFIRVEETLRFGTVFGSVALLRAAKAPG